MPAAAVASFTPEIAGMSGTSVGARGETALDMGRNPKRRQQDETDGHGRICSGHANFLAGLSCRTALQDVMAGINPAITIVNRIGFAEVTADSYFFGAILLSAGFAASALASVAAAS